MKTSATCSAIADRHRPVGRDHTAERRHRVARVRLRVGLGDVGADRDAARVRVLDDRHRRLGEVVRRPPRGVRVDVVVVATSPCRAAAPPGRGRAPPPGRRRARPLVRVLAVPQHRLTRPGVTRRRPASRCLGVGRARSARTTTPPRRRRSPCARTPPRRAAAAAPSVNPPSATAASTSAYWSGEVTTATLGWFFAAARTIDGPPMSICSMHSSASAPDATVSVNG